MSYYTDKFGRKRRISSKTPREKFYGSEMKILRGIDPLDSYDRKVLFLEKHGYDLRDLEKRDISLDEAVKRIKARGTLE